jgi:hypothetical protein
MTANCTAKTQGVKTSGEKHCRAGEVGEAEVALPFLL